MLALLQLWIKEGASGVAGITSDDVLKFSNKLDALIIILLGRANLQIRKLCISILMHFHSVTEKLGSAFESNTLSLFGIMVKFQSEIAKEALYAFAIDGMGSNALSPSIMGGLEPINFFEIACSDYVLFYQYFFGSAVKRFAAHGQPKALRHCGKFLRAMVIPLINTPKATNPDARFDHLSQIILLMGLAGVTVFFMLSICAHIKRTILKHCIHWIPSHILIMFFSTASSI